MHDMHPIPIQLPPQATVRGMQTKSKDKDLHSTNPMYNSNSSNSLSISSNPSNAYSPVPTSRSENSLLPTATNNYPNTTVQNGFPSTPTPTATTPHFYHSSPFTRTSTIIVDRTRSVRPGKFPLPEHQQLGHSCGATKCTSLCSTYHGRHDPSHVQLCEPHLVGQCLGPHSPSIGTRTNAEHASPMPPSSLFEPSWQHGSHLPTTFLHFSRDDQSIPTIPCMAIHTLAIPCLDGYTLSTNPNEPEP